MTHDYGKLLKCMQQINGQMQADTSYCIMLEKHRFMSLNFWTDLTFSDLFFFYFIRRQLLYHVKILKSNCWFLFLIWNCLVFRLFESWKKVKFVHECISQKIWVDINHVPWHCHEPWMWLITQVHNFGSGVPPVRHIFVFSLFLHTHANSWQSIK